MSLWQTKIHPIFAIFQYLSALYSFYERLLVLAVFFLFKITLNTVCCKVVLLNLGRSVLPLAHGPSRKFATFPRDVI